MKFKRIELGVKIGSLGDEARRIRAKELSLLHAADKRRAIALFEKKGFVRGMDQMAPPELEAELKRRIEPQLKRMGLFPDGRMVDKTGRKVIRKYLRQGLSKEEILALPGIKASLKNIPIYETLRRTRKGVLRHASRHAQLALAFLREREYRHTEDMAHSYPNWDKVAEIAKIYSQEDSRILMQRFEQWQQEATQFIRGREIMAKAKFSREPLFA